MEAFDRHDPTHMDVKEFVFVLEGLVSHIKDTTILDTLIASLLEERKVRGGACSLGIFVGSVFDINPLEQA